MNICREVKIVTESVLLQEKVLTKSDRDKMRKTTFGEPDKKAYPLNDAGHVRAAIGRFNNCPEKDKPYLAHKICIAAKKYGVKISEDSVVYKYNQKYLKMQSKKAGK